MNAGTVMLAARLRARMRASGWLARATSAGAELAGALDRRTGAVGPRLAVPEEQVGHGQTGDPVERGERALRRRVERRRHHLRAHAACQRVARAERVAGEQDAVLLEVHRAVPVGVAGRRDDPRTAGDVEDLAVGERRDLADPR